MLLQTNSYVVPKEKRAEHARLVRKFRQTLARLGCDQFDVFEQVGPNWGGGETTGRFVQMMRFRDRKHQVAVQAAEKQDSAAQQLIQEFCELINFGYQQQQGLFAVGYYQSVLPVAPMRMLPVEGEQNLPPAEPEAEAGADAEPQFESAAAPQSADDTHVMAAGNGGGELDIEPDLDMGMEEGANNNSNPDFEAAADGGRDAGSMPGATDEHLGTDDLDLDIDTIDLSDVSGHEHDQQHPQRPPHP